MVSPLAGEKSGNVQRLAFLRKHAAKQLHIPVKGIFVERRAQRCLRPADQLLFGQKIPVGDKTDTVKVRRLGLEDLVHFRLAGGGHDHRALFLRNAIEQLFCVTAFIIVMNQPLQHLECVKAERKDLFRDPLGADQLGKVRNNFASWEITSKDRGEFLSLLDKYLDPRIDLITIQLGENANDLSTWKNDWIDLINYIKTKNEKAKIVVIGDFWSFPKRDEGKIEAAKQCGAIFIDLSDIKDNKSYQSCMNCSVLDDEGKEHPITHCGVAAHPGDLGMKEIAMRIISSI